MSGRRRDYLVPAEAIAVGRCTVLFMEVRALPDEGAVLVDGHHIHLAGGGSATAEVATLLGAVPAVYDHRTLEVIDPLAPDTVENIEQALAVFATWLSRPVPRLIVDTRPPKERALGVAAFFSGGVDGFFTAVTRPDVEALIFVHGFDIRLANTSLREQAAENAREAAQHLGKELIEIVTDMKDYPPIDVNWGMAHGSAMAAVAHMVADRFGKVYIPATYTYADAFPWGSHPLTDPLWSSDRVRIVHHGAAVTRFDKLGVLARHPVAAAHLRVCWENRRGRFNCGQCEKCTRTMVALRAHGVLEEFRTFPDGLDLNRVRFGELNHPTQVAFTRQGLAAVEQSGDTDLAHALRLRLLLGPQIHRARTARDRARGAVRRLRASASGER